MSDNYPLPSYNFRASISELGPDKKPLSTTSLSFSEISGLSKGYEQIDFRESRTETGGSFPESYGIRGQSIVDPIIMRRGISDIAGYEYMYNWMEGMKKKFSDTRDIDIYLMDSAGKDILQWTIEGAMPIKLDSPTFNAITNEVAIESITLVANDITFKKIT